MPSDEPARVVEHLRLPWTKEFLVPTDPGRIARSTVAAVLSVLLLVACQATAAPPAPTPPRPALTPAQKAVVETGSQSQSSAGTSSPSPLESAGAIPLPYGCSEDRPCNLQAGTYVLTGKHAFMPGLKITVPFPWTSREQDAGEFRVAPADETGAVFFWKDLTPVTFDGKLLPDVDASASGLVDWLRSNPSVVTSAPRHGTLGEDIPATTLVVGVSEAAKNGDPDCPAEYGACVGLFTDTAHWRPGGIGYAIGRQDKPLYLRLYVADVVTGAVPHTLVVGVDAGNAQGLRNLESFAEPILRSVVLPPGTSPVKAAEATEAPSSDTATLLASGCGGVAPCALRPGTYVTGGQWPFMRGLKFAIPADGWTSTFHALGELALQPPGFDDYGVFLAKDPVAVPGHRKLATDTDGTAAGLAAWIARHPDLTVSDPEQTTIGDGIEATTVAVSVAPDAETDDPECPTRACVDFIQSKHHEHALGLAQGQYVRLYFADIGTASALHMLSVNLYAGSEEELVALTEVAQPVVDSLVPPEVIIED
ncbi:MAG: hypothetical protein ACR2JZ_02985 [Candidatus Limnocylindrales bacterium]